MPDNNITKEIAEKLQSNESGELVIPEFYNVICEDAFYDRKDLISVTANSITQIKSTAFGGCSNLKNINFPSVTYVAGKAFMDSILGEVNFPSMTTIDHFAFMYYDQLTRIDLPQLKSIPNGYAFSSILNLEVIKMDNLNDVGAHGTDGDFLFYGCPKLKEIRIGNKEIAEQILEILDPDCIEAKVYIGNSDRTVDDDINSSYTGIKYSDQYTDVDRDKANELLNSANFRDGVLTIPENYNGRILNKAFQNIDSLISINLNNIHTICQEAFMDCNNLTEICGKSNITKIGDRAFSGCEKLNKISFPTVTVIEGSTFEGCENLENVCTQNINTIEDCAFYICKKLNNIDLSNATNIKRLAFDVCESLQTIELPLITTINEGALRKCRNLEKISMPKIENLDPTAFEDCDNLREIITTSIEQCELIFNNLCEPLKSKVKGGKCNLFYETKIWNCKDYLEKIKEPENPA